MSARPTIYAHGNTGRYAEQARGPRRGPLTPKRSARHSYRAWRAAAISWWVWFGVDKFATRPKRLEFWRRQRPALAPRLRPPLEQYLKEAEKVEGQRLTKEAIPEPGRKGILARLASKFLFKKKEK